MHPVILKIRCHRIAEISITEASDENTEPEFKQKWAELHSNRDDHKCRSDADPAGKPVDRQQQSKAQHNKHHHEYIQVCALIIEGCAVALYVEGTTHAVCNHETYLDHDERQS